VLIVDVGRNTDLLSSGTTFFDRAKKCASKIIERRVNEKKNIVCSGNKCVLCRFSVNLTMKLV